MRTFVSLALAVVGVSGCFDPSSEDVVTAGGTTDDDGGTFGSDTGGTEDDSASDSITTQTASATMTASTTQDTDVDTSSTDPDTSTGNTELGPRIVMSVPANGDTNASLSGYFLLYFDRVVGLDDAVGHIFVSQNGSEPQPITPMACPPDADPTCIAGVFPEEFVGADTNLLPGGTTHTITVEADFPDPDGMVNTMDQTVEFTTFAYDANFYDDSNAIAQELGGLAYDPGSESLFLVGVPANFGDECVVRRIPLPDGVPDTATTVATPTMSYLCYGMDAIEGTLYVAGSYSNNVFQYTGLGAASLDASETIIANPTLMPPLDNLDEVWSIARGGSSTFFSHGEFFGATEDTSILRLSDGGVWSEFESGENLWDTANGVVIAGANIDATDVLFVAAEGTIRKFRISDGSILSETDYEELGYDPDLHVDSAGRLWLGTDNGIVVLDGTTDAYEELASRPGLEATRLALREEGSTVHAYYARFRSDGHVGHVAIEF